MSEERLAILNKIATTVEPGKVGAELRSAEQPRTTVPAWELPSVSGAVLRHGWGSRLRSYFILDPLIWAYTIILGTISLIASLFDHNGRIQHRLASFWSWLVMKTILSPVRVTGNATALARGADGKARVFAVTHASALDIPILYVYLPFQFRIVFKSELLSYPFVGWHLERGRGRFALISKTRRPRSGLSSRR